MALMAQPPAAALAPRMFAVAPRPPSGSLAARRLACCPTASRPPPPRPVLPAPPSIRPRRCRPGAPSAPARRSMTTRCPSSAPHFFIYPNVCFTPLLDRPREALAGRIAQHLALDHEPLPQVRRLTRLPRPQHQQVRPASPQPVLPLDATTAVHHPLQVRLQDELRTGFGVVAEAPPTSARNAPRRTCRTPSATSSCSSRRRRPRTTPGSGPGCSARCSPAPAAPTLRVNRVRDARWLVPVNQAQVAHVLQVPNFVPRLAAAQQRLSMTRRTRASSSLCAKLVQVRAPREDESSSRAA